jgi:hypothetical protein
VDRREAFRRKNHAVVSARDWPAPPPGFVLRPLGASAVYVAEASQADLDARGLASWDGWTHGLASGSTASGRGATAVVEGRSGAPWRLKRMRRGGLLAGFWRDRYASPRRPVATLAASVQARSRGVPTADPIALIVEAAPYGLARGAIAFAEIEGSEDLARRVTRGIATRGEIAAAIDVVRAMHDRGVRHPDLNLGNVLLRVVPGATAEAFVIDFDRATFSSAPLPFADRQAAVRRLERSCAKLTGAPGPLGPGSEELWYTLYAGGDAGLAGRLASGRSWGRLTLALHRLGWKRRPT